MWVRGHVYYVCLRKRERLSALVGDKHLARFYICWEEPAKPPVRVSVPQPRGTWLLAAKGLR